MDIATGAVNKAELADGAVNHAKLAEDGGKLGTGSDGQFLTSDGKGEFKWTNQAPPNNNTITLTAGAGLSGGGDFTVDQSSDEAIQFDLDASVAGTGLGHSAGVLSVDATQAITNVTGDFAIAGDLTVSGKTITTATETLEIADNTMLLNSDASSAENAGLIVETKAGDNTSNNPALFYDKASSGWVMATCQTGFSDAKDKAKISSFISNSSLDATSTSVPVGGFQEVGGALYVRTS